MNKELTESFARWYKAYPRKKAPGTAKKVWERLSPDHNLVNRMIEAAELQGTEYLKANGPQSGTNAWKFFPLPSTWLNGESWDNEVILKKKEYVKRDKICGAHHCTAPATNAGKLGVYYCVDHWDGHDPERADMLREHFISLGIRQDENGWKTPCMAYMKRLGGFGKLVGGVK